MEFIYNHTGVFMGLLLFIAALVMGCFPKLTTIYHFMSSERQKKVDLKGLRRHLFFGFTLLGFLVIGTDFLPFSEEVTETIRMIILFLGVLFLVGTTQRYDHNRD
ncbi:MAG: DUF3784 domain-containing protein [Alistipes sp.]